MVLMFTPISCAASRSWAVARIARPSRERLTNRWSVKVSTAVTRKMKTLRYEMLAPSTWNRASTGKIWGADLGEGPKITWMRF